MCYGENISVKISKHLAKKNCRAWNLNFICHISIYKRTELLNHKRDNNQITTSPMYCDQKVRTEKTQNCHLYLRGITLTIKRIS